MQRAWTIPMVLAVAVAGVALSPGDARACRLAGIEEHRVVDDPSDTTPPSAPVVDGTSIHRAEDPACRSNGECDHGSVTFAVDATDDRTPTDSLGYSATVVDGEWPNDSVLLPTMRRARGGDLLYLWQNDEGAPFYVKLELRAIDAAGNRSEPTVVEVSDGEVGCALGSGSSGLAPVALALLVLVAGVARRRRASRAC